MAKRSQQRRIDEVLNTPIRPAHYRVGMVHEVYKCLEAWGLHTSAYLWTVVKYIARAGVKDPTKKVEDLRKARWYLDREIELLEGREKYIVVGKHVTPGRKRRR